MTGAHGSGLVAGSIGITTPLILERALNASEIRTTNNITDSAMVEEKGMKPKYIMGHQATTFHSH
jgi:hypothetical protein